MMSRLDWRISLTCKLTCKLLVATAVVLGFAASAHADARLYTGSLKIDGFANTTSDGTAPPFSYRRVVGIPLTGMCNTLPLHLKETLQFPATTTASGAVLGPRTFTIPTYGGAVATTSGSVPGCGYTTVESGDPLTGGGAAVTTGAAATSRTPMNPRKFTLPKSDLIKVKSGASFSAYGAYLWEVHFGDLRNEDGVFSKSGGDGSLELAYGGTVLNPDRKVTQTPGANQFGGVMRLLGFYGDNEGYYYETAELTSVFVFDNWLFDYIGAPGQATAGGVVTAGYKATDTWYGYTRTYGFPATTIGYAAAFKWTTGMVTVEANQGTFPSHQVLTGYDNRTPMGSGMVQLVSPMLTHWVGATEASTAAIGILKIDFAPEPSEWAMLAGGVSMLGLLVYTRRSRD